MSVRLYHQWKELMVLSWGWTKISIIRSRHKSAETAVTFTYSLQWVEAVQD